MVYCKRLSKNKTFEIQIDRWEEWSWFNLNIELTRKQDHAGFCFEFEILSLYFHIWICDNRHWDYDKNSWSTYKGASADTLGEDD